MNELTRFGFSTASCSLRPSGVSKFYLYLLVRGFNRKLVPLAEQSRSKQYFVCSWWFFLSLFFVDGTSSSRRFLKVQWFWSTQNCFHSFHSLCYLGSRISFKVSDKNDIRRHIQLPYKSFGHLRAELFCNQSIRLIIHCQLFEAVMIMLFLWEFKSLGSKFESSPGTQRLLQSIDSCNEQGVPKSHQMAMHEIKKTTGNWTIIVW